MGATNCEVVAAEVNYFNYGGGHLSGYAADLLGLGEDSNASLAAEMQNLLGADLPITYATPQLAGGMKLSAADYALFLTEVLAGGLALRAQLGADPVCTLPGSSCPSSHESPVPEARHYSYGHWVRTTR
jgi:hypothetical protein